MVDSPTVSIVIPHRNGEAMLHSCLLSLDAGRTVPQEVIVVANGTTDGSLDMIARDFPDVRVVVAGSNLGYAGGCNLGLQHARAPIVAFLNNDTEVAPGWLTSLVAAFDGDPTVVAAQPKLLSLQSHRRGERVFDYAGGAGGQLDALGYPFAHGRLGERTEVDHGQYDAPRDLFWASGAAMVARTEAVRAVGGFDGDFFAHMEEIDLAWRLQLVGGRIVSVPDSVVYHLGGSTLAMGSPEKAYLNHRNSVVMLMKNASPGRLLWQLPVRIGLELAAAAQYAVRRGPRWALPPLRGLGWVATHLGSIWRKRQAVQRARRAPSGTVEARLAPAGTVIRGLLRNSSGPVVKGGSAFDKSSDRLT